ncbi:MAG: PorV/PorQ family protein [Bacteroidota bacterium]
MNKNFNYILALTLTAALCFPVLHGFAGNKDRSGSAGASELLINPWARGSGLGNSNVANVKGLEAGFNNVAGFSFTQQTELNFSHTDWFHGSGIAVNNFGLAQRISESSVIGFSIMSMKFGDIQKTTVESPDPSLGSIGTFTPSLLNIALSYSKAFSNSIYGGITFRVINEAVSDMSAQGVALDAGIQYVTGETENIHFGISLKNVGPTMKFKGDGLSFRGYIPGKSTQFTVEQRSAQYELPAQLNIGIAYDIKLAEMHKLTISGAFVSNSFSKDNFDLGAEYSLGNYLMLRAAYTYEQGLWTTEERTTAFTGPSAGCTVQVPFNKEKGSSFAVDYSYRTTNPFGGNHCIGIRVNL